MSQSYNTKAVIGTVVALERRSEADGTNFAPIVEYEVDGRRHRTKGIAGFSPPIHEVDQQIRVLYREDHPSEGYVDSFMDRWFFPLVFTFGGGIFAAIDYWSLRYRRC